MNNFKDRGKTPLLDLKTCVVVQGDSVEPVENITPQRFWNSRIGWFWVYLGTSLTTGKQIQFSYDEVLKKEKNGSRK